MKRKVSNRIPLTLAGITIAIACIVQALPRLIQNLDLAERLEWITYDARAQLAARFPSKYATNKLGGVFIDDQSIKDMNDGKFGYKEKFPWPTHYYGQVVRELKQQGAIAVGFDALFELLDSTKFTGTNEVYGVKPGERLLSDEFFAHEMHEASNVILGATPAVFPAELFRTNATEIGSIEMSRDGDGILRRTRLFTEYIDWHPIIRHQARALDLFLDKAQITPGKIRIPMKEGEPYDVPLNPDGSLNVLEITGDKPPSPQPAFVKKRLWDMGLLLAARSLNLDLANAKVEARRVVIDGPAGLRRILPLDDHGFFIIDWSLKITGSSDDQLAREAIVPIIRDDYWRYSEHSLEVSRLGASARNDEKPKTSLFNQKVVVIGSIATGANVKDTASTPVERETSMLTKHLNVASSIIANRFVSRTSLAADLLILIGLGAIASLLACKYSMAEATARVIGVAVIYVLISVWLYMNYRLWTPVFMPIAGGLIAPYVAMVTYRVVAEQKETRRIKSVFSKVVSPRVVNELLNVENIELGGARRNITVLFADVRGFTEMTDAVQSKAEEFVRKNQLSPEQSEAFYNASAADTLQTVNLYLETIADMVEKLDGTLDKYIGDCVMAFWGAPIPNEQHAVQCVKAAIEAQRAMYAVNQKRFEENKRREEENKKRVAEGKEPLSMLALLSLGTGINTGIAIVGMMGSQKNVQNYTIFGREVNIASRLEGVSGRGRIIISESTYLDLQKFSPELAATCVTQPPVTVKGIKLPLKIFEVPWKPAAAGAGSASAKPAASVATPSTAASVAASARPAAAVPPTPAVASAPARPNSPVTPPTSTASAPVPPPSPAAPAPPAHIAAQPSASTSTPAPAPQPPTAS